MSNNNDLLKPLEAIKKRRYQYAIWAIAAFGLGLAALWLPMLIAIITGQSSYDAFSNIIATGVIATFCIVIIADGLAHLFVTVQNTSNIRIWGFKGLIGMFAFVIAVIQISIFALKIDPKHIPLIFLLFQIIMAIISMLVATYLYCFRYPDLWEKPLDEVQATENREVRALSEGAVAKTADEAGVKL